MRKDKVLIVDDDPFSRGALEKLLQSSGYDARACADAAEAMICLRDSFFDILMTDLHMPGEDGFTLIEKARLIHPGIKTILITGHLRDEVKEKGVSLGVDGFFQKPIAWEQLFALMEALSGSSEAGSYRLGPNGPRSRMRGLTKSVVLASMVFLLALFQVPSSMGAELRAVQYRPTLRPEVRRDCTRSLSGLLGSEQLKMVRELQEAFYAEATPIRRDLLIASIEFWQLLSDPKIDPHIVFDRHKKVLELQYRLEHLSLSYQMKARSVFTQEQLDRLPRDCMLGMETGFGMNLGIGRAPRKGYRR